jgi:hypothetical protein
MNKNIVTTLKVKKCNDARGSFPDTGKIVIMLYQNLNSLGF